MILSKALIQLIMGPMLRQTLELIPSHHFKKKEKNEFGQSVIPVFKTLSIYAHYFKIQPFSDLLISFEIYF